MDDTPERDRVFQYALQNSFSIRLATAVYSISPQFVRAVLLLLYGAKCHASLSIQPKSTAEIIFLASYPSEKRVLGHVRRALANMTTEEMSISVWNCLRPGAILAHSHYLVLTPRLFSFARRLARRHSFMPACRIFSLVPYYTRAKRLLSPNNKAVFIASQYAPETLALASASHSAGRKVFFVNHANATGKGRYVPPIHADLVGASSQAIADIYQEHSPKSLNIHFWPAGEAQGPMRALARHGGSLRVGIYLTGLTNEQRLSELLLDCHKSPLIGSCFVRPHPVKVVRPRLHEVDVPESPFSVSENTLLEDDIQRTDLAICGNSTAAIALLRAGRPVLYDAGLDSAPFDYNGYFEAGLLMPYSSAIDESKLDAIDQFYAADCWVASFRYFDCGYQRDEDKMRADFAAEVQRVLGA